MAIAEQENSNSGNDFSIVMMGATGAVGGETLKSLLPNKKIQKLTLLGRRPVEGIDQANIHQHEIDIFEPSTYAELVKGHNIAICTLGVGEPSKMNKEDYVRIDKTAVLDFAKACKDGGVRHFELLSSVGISAKSSQYYLRTKGELVEELKALNFDRLSIFQPSMILTPKNRYGFSQGVLLFIWPLLKPVLLGGLRQYRGIKVDTLGQAIAQNLFTKASGLEYLKWDDFQNLASGQS